MALRTFQFGLVFAIGLFLNVVNCAFSSNHSAKIVEKGVHSFLLNDPEDVVVTWNQNATFRCDVTSVIRQGLLRKTWLFNNAPVVQNDSRWTIGENGSTLFVPSVNDRSLIGEYRCEVENHLGKVVSNVARLRFATMAAFDEASIDIAIPEKQPILLPCELQSLPLARISWKYNSKPLSQSSRYIFLASGSLLILESTSSDTGLYRCLAANTVLNKTISKQFNLNVLPQLNKPTKPEIVPISIPQQELLVPDQSIDIYCAATGWPLPKIKWQYQNTTIANTTVLHIDVSTKIQHFKCVAENSVDTVSKNYVIEVRKPYFFLTPISVVYKLASTIKLNCLAAGNPRPCVQWFKNGEELKLGGRIRKIDSGLAIYNAVTNDSAIYQCVASNTFGRVWVTADVVYESRPPGPPIKVQCRAYDETSICVTWVRPQSKYPIVAYSVHSYIVQSGNCIIQTCGGFGPEKLCEDNEIIGPEMASQELNTHIADLEPEATYNFYVRLYSLDQASDNAARVTCSTGIEGQRNLSVTVIGNNTVELKWSNVSTDLLCNGTFLKYRVEWKKNGSSHLKTAITDRMFYTIKDLNPLRKYVFGVRSAVYDREEIEWVSANVESTVERNIVVDYDKTEDGSLDFNIPIPDEFEVHNIHVNSVELSWSTSYVKPGMYYTICFTEYDKDQLCENGKIVKSVTNEIILKDLTPNTEYECKVRTHEDKRHGSFTAPLKFKTKPEVPSHVEDLKYKIINESSVCLIWNKPSINVAIITGYVINYNNDETQLLSSNITIIGAEKTDPACGVLRKGAISVLLVNLKPLEHYTVIVRPLSVLGEGNPTQPIYFSTSHSEGNSEDLSVLYKQKLAIIIGCLISVVCIAFCVACILLRKRCVKRRALSHLRASSSNNYYPAIARYASQGNSVQVRLENSCAAELHETQHLVNDDTTILPQVTPTTLDCKGGDSLLNGHVNGVSKQYTNGQIVGGQMNITENPQFQMGLKKCLTKKNGISKSGSKILQEDSNSNFQTSDFQDLEQCIERNSAEVLHHCSKHSADFKRSSLDSSKLSYSDTNSLEDLNTTELTCLEDSFLSSKCRRLSPIIGPNG